MIRIEILSLGVLTMTVDNVKYQEPTILKASDTVQNGIQRNA